MWVAAQTSEECHIFHGESEQNRYCRAGLCGLKRATAELNGHASQLPTLRRVITFSVTPSVGRCGSDLTETALDANLSSWCECKPVIWCVLRLCRRVGLGSLPKEPSWHFSRCVKATASWSQPVLISHTFIHLSGHRHYRIYCFG